MHYSALTAGTMFLIWSLLPYATIIGVGSFAIGISFFSFSYKAEDEMREMETLTRSPIYAHLAISLEGLL
jgi:hypothetical protein